MVMTIKFPEGGGSYLPSGEWESSEQVAARVRSGSSSPDSYFFGGQETSPGTFVYQANQNQPTYQSALRPITPMASGTQNYTTPSPSGSMFPSSGQMFGGFGGKESTADMRRSTGGGVTTSYSKWSPSEPTPTYEAGSFEAPEYDESKVLAGQQKFAAPSIRRLREQVQSALSQTYENPNVKAMTVREALQGYGSGLETTMAGAYGRAVSDYDRRYKLDWEERAANFRAQETAKQQTFQAALQSWAKTGTAVSGPGTGGPGGATEAGATGGNGGYSTPTGNIGYYTPEGQWVDGKPNISGLRRA